MNAHPEITATMATDWLSVYCGPGALGLELDVQLAKVLDLSDECLPNR